MKKNPKLEYIEWFDPTSHHSEWVSLETYSDKVPYICKSVGWVVRDDRGKAGTVVVVPHLSLDEKRKPDSGGGDMQIPKSLIIKRVVIDL